MTLFGGCLLIALALAAADGDGPRAPPADPRPPRAIDDALDLFSAAARKQAGERIRELRQATGKDLKVETLPRLPDEQHRKLAALDRKGQDRLLAAFAEERALRREVNGVYVLLVRDPGRVQVVVWPPEVGDLFGDAARFRVYQMFTSKEFDRDPGAGLLRAVDLVRDELQAAQRARHAPPVEHGSVPWTALLVLLAGLLGLWGLLTWKRPREAKQPAANPGAGALGQLVGQPGEWLAGRLSGGQEPAAPAAPAEEPPAPVSAPAPAHLSPEEKELWRPHDHP